MINFITEFLSHKERESIYHVLFEEFQEAIVILHKDKIINANKKSCLLYGYDLYDMVGKDYSFLFTGKSDTINDLQDCEIIGIEYHKNRFEDTIPVNVSYKQVLFDNKECYLLVIRNISNCLNTHKYIEKMLKYKDALVICSKILLKNGNLLKTLEDTLETIIKLSDFSRIYLFENYIKDNDAFAKMVVDKCSEGSISYKDDPQVKEFRYVDSPCMRSFLSSPSPVQYTVSDIRNSSKDFAIMDKYGMKTALIIPVYVNENLYGFLGFDDCVNEVKYNDVTIDMLQIMGKLVGFYIAKKKYEESLHKSKEMLEDIIDDRTKEIIQKNAELEGFAYSLSHEIRSPLSSIDMLAHSIEREDISTLPQDVKEYFYRTHIEVHHVLELSNSLLTLFKINKDSLNIQETNLSLMLSNVYDLSYKRKGDLIFTLNIQEEIKYACDQNLIRIVFENMLNNSIKYRDKNRRLVVEFSKVEIDGIEVFKFEDNGIGMDMSKTKDLFKPFYRVHPKSYPGSGIGLSLVKKIISVHGGQIWFESEVNKGTIFYFTLG